MGKLKQKKAITLVALVITIIILLILAGITISLTIGQQGILRRAEEAGKNYMTATEYENQQLTNFLKEMDEIIEGKKELPENALAKKVKIGDYVAYDPTAGVADTSILEYKSPVGTGMVHGNGHSEQKFTATSSTKWRVLSKDEITGEVVLISDEPIQTDVGVAFYMHRAIGYLYAEQELNEICKIYGYGKGADTSKVFSYKIGDVIEGESIGTIQGSGARSINVEDINRITQYDPMTFSVNDNGITYKYNDAYTHIIFHPTRTTQTGISTAPEERRDIWTTYFYQASAYLADTESPSYKMLFGDNNLYYWIASRGVNSLSTSSGFYVFLTYDGLVNSFYLCDGYYNNFFEHDGCVGVRPVVYLKPDILTNEQNENGAWVISE